MYWLGCFGQVRSLRSVGLVSQLGLVGLVRLFWSGWDTQVSCVGQSVGFGWLGQWWRTLPPTPPLIIATSTKYCP